MLFFGHIGITTGVVKVCQKLTTGRKSVRSEIPLKLHSAKDLSKHFILRGSIYDKIKSIDYRFVLLGSLLPDIIDKPMWLFTSSHFDWAGRGYAHTFLFNFLLLAIGLILVVRWNKTWLVTIALCSFIHLIFDQMWLTPTTLWWPLMGSIPREATVGWVSALTHGLKTNPYVYVSETMGFIITLYLSLRLVIQKREANFLKTGNLD